MRYISTQKKVSSILRMTSWTPGAGRLHPGRGGTAQDHHDRDRRRKGSHSHQSQHCCNCLSMNADLPGTDGRITRMGFVTTIRQELRHLPLPMAGPKNKPPPHHPRRTPSRNTIGDTLKTLAWALESTPEGHFAGYDDPTRALWRCSCHAISQRRKLEAYQFVFLDSFIVGGPWPCTGD